MQIRTLAHSLILIFLLTIGTRLRAQLPHKPSGWCGTHSGSSGHQSDSIGSLTSFQRTAGFTFEYVIPVVVHVIHAGGTEQNIDIDDANSQIEVLNEDFGKYGAGANSNPFGADTRIRFCLAAYGPDGTPTNGIDYHYIPESFDLNSETEDLLIKENTIWDPDRYLNIWTVRRINGGSILGYSYFPEYEAGQPNDGVVVDHRFFGRLWLAANSRGRTVTHEVGHYLGLMHPWGLTEDECDEDDGCDDTPAVSGQYFSDFPACNAPFACDGVTPRMIENYMDYSEDGCMNIFTECQAGIMRHSIVAYRSTLISTENHYLTGCADSLVVSTEDSLAMYPNPASEATLFYVNFDSELPVLVTMYDGAGRRIVYNQQAGFGTGPARFETAGFAAGLYIIEVSVGTYSVRKRLQIRH